MAQLPKTIEAKAEIVITKGVAHRELLLRRHSNFKFVLSACVGDDFPVVLSIHERPV